MGTKDTDRVISYALFWLEHAGLQVLDDPRRGVYHWTHINYSGGYTGWEDEMSQVYHDPRTLEERLLQGQVHEVMLHALEWALREAEMKTPREWSAWGSMDLSEAYRISHMVVRVDPLRACALKIRLNKICMRMGKSLNELAGINFMTLMGPATGIQW